MGSAKWYKVSDVDKRSDVFVWWGSVLIFLIIFSLVCIFFLFSASRDWQWGSVFKYHRVMIDGWVVTLWVSMVSLISSMVVGTALATAQLSSIIPIKAIGSTIVEFLRGTPLLVQIMFFFYVVADAAGIENRYLVGIITLSFYSGTYIAEVIRGGIQASGKSQMLAARSVGMTSFQSYRFVIVPQAIRSILPALAGQLVALIKHSSLLSVIAVEEFTFSAKSVNAITYSTLESYLPLLVGYLILTLIVSRLAGLLEKRWRYES